MDAINPDPGIQRAPRLEYYVKARPMEGMAVSGDAFLVTEAAGGVLVCVMDGLGHGEEAAKAAEVAKGLISRYAGDALLDLVRHCHEGLKQTRGIVASFVRFEPEEDAISWVGVGNVEALVFNRDAGSKYKREALASRGGVIGYTLPSLHCSSLAVHAGDFLVMATDGIAGAFIDGIDLDAPLALMADRIVEEYGKTSDDVLVLTARYLGGNDSETT